MILRTLINCNYETAQGSEAFSGQWSHFLVNQLFTGEGGRGCSLPPSQSYRSISSSRGVASPAKDMGVLSIIGLGEGRGVIL